MHYRTTEHYPIIETPAVPAAHAVPAPSAARAPIFVGGAGRSGTTLLRVILDSHSSIACGPELKVIPSVAYLWAQFQTKYAPFLAEARMNAEDVDRIFRGFIGDLLEPLRRHERKARVAEKSPNNVFYFSHLHRIFPDATFLHMLRDGRDVVASLLTMDWKTPDGHPVGYTREPRLAARYWADAVIAARSFAHQTQGRSRYREIRYEELVAAPEACLRPLFAYLEEPWEPGVLAYYERQRALGDESSAESVTRPMHRMSVGRWQTQLTLADRAAVKDEIGALLIELRYCDNLDW
jgi:hypothetical protein